MNTDVLTARRIKWTSWYFSILLYFGSTEVRLFPLDLLSIDVMTAEEVIVSVVMLIETE
jgi:hypothetical protein